MKILCEFDSGFTFPTLELGDQQAFERRVLKRLAGRSLDMLITDDLVLTEGSGKSILPVTSPSLMCGALCVSGISLTTLQMVAP